MLRWNLAINSQTEFMNLNGQNAYIYKLNNATFYGIKIKTNKKTTKNPKKAHTDQNSANGKPDSKTKQNKDLIYFTGVKECEACIDFLLRSTEQHYCVVILRNMSVSLKFCFCLCFSFRCFFFYFVFKFLIYLAYKFTKIIMKTRKKNSSD